MNHDVIIKGRNNHIFLDFTFDVPTKPDFGLKDFTNIELKFGAEVYNSNTDPEVVVVASDTRLRLSLGATSEEFSSYFVINAYNGTYPEGFQLTSRCLDNLTVPKLVGCE
jgi:hypothetical protein